jgi:hypothetical protein
MKTELEPRSMSEHLFFALFVIALVVLLIITAINDLKRS